MRYLFYTLLLFAGLLLSCSENAGTDDHSSADRDRTTVIYLSRHAEKAGGDDPELLPEGRARADRLATRIGKNLDAVYATGYRRTQQTAAPAARAAGVRVRKYNAGKAASRMTERWRKRHRGDTILVVGHSNTVPDLLNALVGEQRYTDLAAGEFSRLFRVTIDGRGTTSVEELSSD